MKIQYLNGGLANQVFQYIFYRYGQLSNSNEEWYIDDSFFYVNNVHNGYELEKVFGLKPNLLSNAFDPDVWDVFISNKKNGISVPQTFKNLGFDIKMIAEFDNYKTHNPFDGAIYRIPGNEYAPEIVTVTDEYLYYHGYWLHPDWFYKYQDIFLKELAFPPIEDDYNQSIANAIFQSHSVAIHIRRGDYVTLGWNSLPEYYLSQTTKVIQKYPDVTFFVFSDDIFWCKENAHSLGLNLAKETFFVEGNLHGNNFRDLQLMSMCQILLAGKSAFSYLSTLLNPRLEMILSDNTPR